MANKKQRKRRLKAIKQQQRAKHVQHIVDALLVDPQWWRLHTEMRTYPLEVGGVQL